MKTFIKYDLDHANDGEILSYIFVGIFKNTLYKGIKQSEWYRITFTISSIVEKHVSSLFLMDRLNNCF